MSKTLFNRIIFGPVNSRRLGKSLGINLLPDTVKLCSMDCIYCECGWGDVEGMQHSKLLSADEIIPVLTERFKQMHDNNAQIDSITYSGNGEPTLHPQFAEITQAIIKLRDLYFPKTIITCLSNSTQLHRSDVLETLKSIDNPLMKLDAGTQSMFELLNKPFSDLQLDDICENLRRFEGKLSIQTLFLRGKLDDNTVIDNTLPNEVDAWLKRLMYIRPQKVILYPIDRETPVKLLEKIDKNTLAKIALKVQEIGIETESY